MAYQSTQGEIYRLRAGSPMPTSRSGDFVLHTFMAEKNRVVFETCVSQLPGSEDFRGQGADPGLISANYTRMNIKGGEVFSGKKVYSPDYVDEDDI